MGMEWQSILQIVHKEKALPSPNEFRYLASPPQDRGRAAWTALIAAIVAQSLLFNFTLSFGVFQDHYHNTFNGTTSASWIATLCSGLPFLGAPVMTYICEHSICRRKYLLYAGWSLYVVGLFASAFCTSVPGLILLQGLVYGTGLMILEMPLFITLNSWFVERRGLAYGLIFGGADLGGLVFTFLADILLRKLGLRNTVLIYTACASLLGGPAIIMLKRRKVVDNKPPVLESQVSSTPSQDSFSTDNAERPKRQYHRRVVFYLFLFANLSQSFAWYLPFTYLPQFAMELDLPHIKGTTALALANAAQIFGEIGFGKASDKMPVSYLAITCAMIMSLSTFLLWGFARSCALVWSYGIIFGGFGAGFAALWPRIGSLFGDHDATMVYSGMSMTRGLGALLSSAVSNTLLARQEGTKLTNIPNGFITGHWAGLIIFVGSSTAISAVLCLLVPATMWWKERALRLNKLKA